MDIFALAMQIEQEGRAYYLQIASRTRNNGLKTILTWLADEENKHYHIFERLKENHTARLQASAILADAKRIFAEMKPEVSDAPLEPKQLDMYQAAQKLEEKSREFYLAQAQGVADASLKDMLLAIAEEEKKHYFLLEHIIVFVSQPQVWLENAEFNHLDEY